MAPNEVYFGLAWTICQWSFFTSTTSVPFTNTGALMAWVSYGQKLTYEATVKSITRDDPVEKQLAVAQLRGMPSST